VTQTPVYDRIGVGYADLRVPDPRIGRQLVAALGPARSVVNVGAGTGSYEPEPSAVMVAQRPVGAAPVVRARAEALPFPDGCVDAALAVLTTHHWADPLAGLAELVRVATRQVVLTWDQAYTAQHFWFIRDYLPEAAERESGLAALDTVLTAWPDAEVSVVPVPWDCTDGFFAAYWRRPEALLVPAVRASISGLALLEPQLVDRAIDRLARDLATGTWAGRYADLGELESLDCGYRLVVRESPRLRT
jgi:SAM-dependent methyltransferase